MKKKSSAKTVTEHAVLLFLPVIVIIAVWQILCNQGAINASLLPSPETIVLSFVQMITDGSLWGHISASLLRILKGFLIGTVAGIVIGILMGIFPKFEKSLTLIVGILRPIPIIALIPLLILWFGIGETSKVATIILGTFWPVLINTIYGVKSVDKKLLDLAKILQKTYLQTLVHITIPSAFPAMFTGIRLGVGNALVCVITAEMIAASQGLGFLIMYARQMSQPNIVLVGIITIGVIGLILDLIFQRLQKLVERG